jgi:hypothetical protein
MDTTSDISLRPRFSIDIDENIDAVRQKFVDYAKEISPDYLMKIRNYHIQFTIRGEKQRFWSPHLSIELEEKEGHEKSATHLRGMFGPAQTMWTFFIFLHFLIAGVFLIFMMFAISNYLIKQPVLNDVIIMMCMVTVWVLLYFIAKQTRSNGYSQMEELEKEMKKIIS